MGQCAIGHEEFERANELLHQQMVGGVPIKPTNPRAELGLLGTGEGELDQDGQHSPPSPNELLGQDGIASTTNVMTLDQSRLSGLPNLSSQANSSQPELSKQPSWNKEALVLQKPTTPDQPQQKPECEDQLPYEPEVSLPIDPSPRRPTALALDQVIDTPERQSPALKRPYSSLATATVGKNSPHSLSNTIQSRHLIRANSSTNNPRPISPTPLSGPATAPRGSPPQEHRSPFIAKTPIQTTTMTNSKLPLAHDMTPFQLDNHRAFVPTYSELIGMTPKPALHSKSHSHHEPPTFVDLPHQVLQPNHPARGMSEDNETFSLNAPPVPVTAPVVITPRLKPVMPTTECKFQPSFDTTFFIPPTLRHQSPMFHDMRIEPFAPTRLPIPPSWAHHLHPPQPQRLHHALVVASHDLYSDDLTPGTLQPPYASCLGTITHSSSADVDDDEDDLHSSRSNTTSTFTSPSSKDEDYPRLSQRAFRPMAPPSIASQMSDFSLDLPQSPVMGSIQQRRKQREAAAAAQLALTHRSSSIPSLDSDEVKHEDPGTYEPSHLSKSVSASPPSSSLAELTFRG